MERLWNSLAGALFLAIGSFTAPTGPAEIGVPLVDAAREPVQESAAPGFDKATARQEPLADDEAGEIAIAPPLLQLPDGAEREALEERLAALDGAGLAAEDKQRAAEFYQQALKSFDAACQQIAAAQEFQDVLDSLPERTAEIAAKLANPLRSYDDVSGEMLEKVEQRAARLESNLANYRAELSAMIAEPKRRSQRMAELPEQIAEAQQKLKQATDALDALGGEDAADVVALARRAALVYRQAEFRAILLALDHEQQYYQQGGEWVTLRRDFLARYVPHAEKRLLQLRAVINRLREQDAREKVQLAAEAAKVDRPKAIQTLATDNKKLAEERAAVAAQMTKVSQQFADLQKELENLAKQSDRARKQAELDELSNVIGQLLRDQQAKLPNWRALRRNQALRESVRSGVLLRIYDLYDEQIELANLDELTDLIAARSGDLGAAGRDEVRNLLEAKRQTLDQLIDTYEDYSLKLNELHSEEAKLILATQEYANFIAERVLWIRSCSALSAADWRHAVRAAAWSLDPRNWRDAGAAILEAGGQQPVLFASFLMGLVVLTAAQRPARRRLQQFGEEAENRSCTNLRATFHALWLTAALALPGPALLAFVGWTMDSLSESEFVRSLGESCQCVAVCLLLLELSRHLCRRVGLAESHFDWPGACLVHVRRKLRWLAVLGTPLVLWLIGLEVQAQDPYWSSSLGRALFIVTMLLLALVLERLLLAKASPFRQLAIAGGGWLAPLQIVWRPAIVLLPAALAVLAAVGYYYTAQQAAVRILQTSALLLSVLALGGLTRRWLLVSRRRLAREQARQRRAQLAAAAEGDSALPEPADEAVDLAALSEQTQKLVRTFLAITTAVGLVLIWGEILPALQYPAKQVLPGAETLTWGHLVTFLLVLAVTYVLVRDVPALLELVILQHLPLDGGSRYAITSVSRYVMTAVGLTAAFNSIGGEWSKIQWLVAAMSVGLGFGLQEIFANFVSGIILLFERPIRVGDVVTLGDKSGVVNRIRMRATTIVDWDRKEYIVPNKDLVTERLLNWTLSDPTNRIVVDIGVAYGSDTDRACELLLEAAREQPHILSDPPPVACFDGFGDSALNLKLMCFLPNLENRLATIHALHTAVDRKFKEAGLEIPFPQRDLNVRFNRDSLTIDLEGAKIAALGTPAAEARRQGAA
jgi:potassium efflux system protein